MKKKSPTEPVVHVAEMRAEYDFSKGVRGKHRKALLDGYTITVHKADGTVEETSVEPSGAVTLAPDVREYFPTSDDVNHALRTLISIVPQKGRTATQHKRNVKAKPLAKTRAKKTG
jgi:hypothetical protein